MCNRLNFVIPGFHLHSDEYRGIAILVTCDYAKSPELGTLPGTNKDFERMKETFDELKYEVHPIRNEDVTQENVERLLKDLKEYLEDYEGKPPKNKDGSNKAIAFAFSGHGDRVEGKDDSSVLCTTDGEISLKKDVMTSVCVEGVKDIPKLYFIDACRGDRDLSKYKGKKPLTLTIESQEGNYRLDFATIPGFVSIDGRWMQVLAHKLREESMESLQHVVANVNKEVHEKNEGFRRKHQLICESRDRLFTGPLYLHPAKYAS